MFNFFFKTYLHNNNQYHTLVNVTKQKKGKTIKLSPSFIISLN